MQRESASFRDEIGMLQGWEIGLLAIAGFISVTALVRLMRVRRDQLTSELLAQAEAEHRRKQEEERRATIKVKKVA
jgi:hypothetical protein